MNSYSDIVAPFVAFAVQKQSLVLDYLYFTSDHFTRDMLKGTVSEADFRTFFTLVTQMAANQTEVKKAVASLQAGPLVDPFCTWLKEVCIRNREGILATTDQMSPDALQKLSALIRPEWLTIATDPASFVEDLENGAYDLVAPLMTCEFFCHSDQFASKAAKVGVTMDRILKKEGALAMIAGAGFAADVSNSERVSYLLKSRASARCALAARSLFTNNDTATLLAALIEDVVDTARTIPESLDGHSKKGILFVEEDQSDSPFEALLFRKSTTDAVSDATHPALVAVTGCCQDQEGVYVSTVLGSGEWEILATDTCGHQDKQKVTVVPGSVRSRTVQTIPSQNDASGWNALCLSYEWLKPLPIFTFPFTFYDYDYNSSPAFWSKHLRIVCLAKDAAAYGDSLKEKQPVKVADREIALYVLRLLPGSANVLIDFISIEGTV